MNAMKLAKVCPSCGASWIPIRGVVIQLSGAGARCQICGGTANGFFSADHDSESRPLWDEERHGWRWESPYQLKRHGVAAWKPKTTEQRAAR